MPFAFSDADFDRLAAALGTPATHDGALVRFNLADAASGRRLVLEVQPALTLPGRDAPCALVQVYGMNSFLQLHDVTGFIASDEMGEVIFFARMNGVTNGLVVERGAGCSLYANVDERLLEADFTRLPAEVTMSVVALSMAESLFDDMA